MNIEEVVIKYSAEFEGKTVQKLVNGEWVEFNKAIIDDVIKNPGNYRIKPEPREFSILLDEKNNIIGGCIGKKPYILYESKYKDAGKLSLIKCIEVIE